MACFCFKKICDSTSSGSVLFYSLMVMSLCVLVHFEWSCFLVRKFH